MANPTGRGAASTLGLIGLASIVLTIVAMLWFSQSATALLSWFSLWVLGPSLVVMALAQWLPQRSRSILLHVLIAIAIAVGPFLYLLVARGPPDAQNALIFLIAPFWQLVGIGAALILGLVVPSLFASRGAKG